MTLVLDTGALLALERNDRQMWVRLKGAQDDDELPLTHAGIAGQAWRGGPRQARLAQALDGIETVPLDEALGRRAGRLLGETGLADVIDAAIVLLSNDGDDIVTSDHDDIAQLASAAGLHVELIHV